MKNIGYVALAIMCILWADAYREVCIIKGDMIPIPEQMVALVKYLLTTGAGFFGGWQLRGRNADN